MADTWTLSPRRNSTSKLVGQLALTLILAGFARPPVQGADDQAGSGLKEQPLAPASRPRGATMFTDLPPEETGVVTENNYADPRMWGERYQEYALGSFGTGIAIGDYDADGRPDILAVSKTEPCRLFRNLGDCRFEDVTVRAGVGAPAGGWMATVKGWFGSESNDQVEAWKQGATFADVDNDGWLDLYICRYDAPNWLFINQRDGTFKEEGVARGLAIRDASGIGAFCDYDRDGWLDVYLQTNMLEATTRPDGQRDYLFRNRGDGTFEDVTQAAGLHGPNLAHSATWWDYDDDGWPDLYVANDFGPPDFFYRNNRDGTFTDVVLKSVPRMPYSSMGADFGDVNNDGRLDFLVADMATTTHEKDQRGMASSRELSREDSESPAPQFPASALYLNTGTGHFLEAANMAGIAGTDWTWSPRWEDLDNDGRLDLHVTNGMNREYQNADLRERIILAESLPQRMRLMRESPVLQEHNLAFRNLGDLQFESVGPAWGLDRFGVSFGAACGDLDGDGDLDVVHSNFEAGVSVLRNDCTTGHRVIFALRGNRSNRFGVGARVRLETAAGVQVRELVVARGYLSGSEPVLHFGLGEETTIRRAVVSWPSGHRQVFENIPADRRFTITEPDAAAAPSREDPPVPAGQFAEVGEAAGFALRSSEGHAMETNEQPLVPVRFNRRGPALAVGDFNADGVEDVAVGGTMANPIRLVPGGSDGRFGQPATLAGPATATLDCGPLAIFDADGDGADDLLVTRAGTNLPAGAADYQPLLFIGDGRGAFRPAPQAVPPLSISAGAVAVADVDRDGRLDVFIGGRVLPGQYPQSPPSALLANRGGRFEDVTDAFAPALRAAGMVSSAMWSDADGDGWLDLLLALEWGGVRWFRNVEGKRLEDESARAGFAAAGSGWWTALAAADFNGDARMDYVAGNVGLNTPYRASAEHPALIFLGRFRAGNRTQLVEAYYEGDRLLPRRTSKALAAEIPSIRQRFPRNDDYAAATLAEIVGADRLAEARRFEATELRSGVFLSQPDGTFRFQPLPRMVQVAPLQGLVAGDFDGDGAADIYAVQNSHAPIPVVGRFAGGIGQFLRGDGHGNFEVVAPLESGLVVPGDAKALVVVDLGADGWPDFLVSRNSDTTLAFRNGGVPGRGSLRVALRGSTGNRTAIGARITVGLSDGSTQTSEVQTGSGYYSQSSSVCFFGFSAAAPPRRVQVRWPDGRTSAHPVAPGAPSVTIAAPPP